MKKAPLFIALFGLSLSAGFWPDFSFSYEHGKGNIDNTFLRDNSKGIVLDTQTGKIYYDAKPSPQLSWKDAQQYCEDLRYLGLKNWRLPSKKEMRSLLELSRRDVTVKHAFRHIKPAIYWSATKDRRNEAWYFDFELGRYWVNDMDKHFHAICVADKNASKKQVEHSTP
ncbi:MAG: DUF1566 domain-containing protein [Sulfurovum sp.]|nr:DUF1566 domain-containing protein [Sulfurovum sp.]